MERSRRLGKLSRGVSVIGVGKTKHGCVATTPEIKGMTENELWYWAAREAMEDANCRPEDIQAQYIGNTLMSQFTHRFHLDGALQRWCGLKRDGLGVAGCRTESACSAGGQAIREAIFAIASGVYDVVIAGGSEITSIDMNSKHPASMDAIDVPEMLIRVMEGCDRGIHYNQEPWNTSLLGGWAVGYMHEFGLSEQDLVDALDARTISRHHNAAHNPKAQMNFEIADYAKERGFATAKDFLNSKFNPFLWWPVKAWHFEIVNDGAAAVIFCATERAREFHNQPIHVLGTGCAHGMLYNKTYSCPAVVEAGRQAYEMAGLSPDDVDLMQCYVCGGNVEITLAEDFGYAPRGEYWKYLIDGRTGFDGDKPVNTDGGLKAQGDAVGAVAADGVHEIVKQMRCETGSRQIHPIPHVALSHVLGGTGDTTHVVTLYGR